MTRRTRTDRPTSSWTDEAVQQKAGKRSRVESRYGSVQQAGGTVAADPEAVHAAADRGIAGGGERLPFMDQIVKSFGAHDVSDVRAHTGSAAAEASQSMGATAYAKGNDIAFGATPDLHTAAHEAAHVVQQRAGVHLKGGVGESGDPYEQHADAVADKVVRGESAEALLTTVSGSGGSGVQMAVSQPGDAAEKEADAVSDQVAEAGKDEEGEAEKLREKKGEPFKIGTEVYVQREMFCGAFKYHHAGVYCGKGQVVHVNSTAMQATKNLLKGRELASVEQTTLKDFKGGGTVMQGPSPHRFTPKERRQRAVSHLGEQWQYRPLSHNCQHFTSETVSGGPNSPEGQDIAHNIGLTTRQDEQKEEANKQKKVNDANFNEELKQNPKGEGG